MRCINNIKLGIFLLPMFLLMGCGNVAYDMPYNPDSEVSSFNIISKPKPGVAAPFASDLCIITTDVIDDTQTELAQTAASAVLFDVNNNEIIYGKNAHERLYPASLTKVMTALVAIKHGSADQILTASDVVNITEPGATLSGLESGDTMTLEQALHILMIKSGNDVAMMIAENIGGSVDGFLEMMNEEARSLGATNTNFMNPHGLSDDNHYTTAYDLYLIFNEAIKYDSFKDIIQMTSYQTTYRAKDGSEKDLSFSNTNLLLRDDYQAPSNITVVGGKTGTTNAARSCLILLSKDTNGASYISVILRAETRDALYEEMIDLLNEIQK